MTPPDFEQHPTMFFYLLFQDIDQPLHGEAAAKQSAAWFKHSYHLPLNIDIGHVPDVKTDHFF